MPSDPNDIAHLLRRSRFAALPNEIATLSTLEWGDAVDAVLDTADAPPLTAPNLDPNRGSYQRYTDMVHLWLDRAATSPAPIAEKMVLFWHGHFCTSLDKVFDHRALFEQNQLFRTGGMGSFYDLTHQVSLQPAMIAYLDNDRNVVGSPNENFARELMELFTLGIGHYTENDVVESARAWTGHGLDANDRYVFDPGDHDNGSKVLFGRPVSTGPDTINVIFTQKPERLSQFMAEKLWSFFAYPGPSASIVDQIAGAFRSTWNITDALRAIFNHPEFRSTRAKQGLIRSPIEFVVAAMKHTGLTCGQVNPQWTLPGMGQTPFRPPNVAGWKQNEYWVSSSAVWAKSSFASGLRWRQYESGVFENIDELEVPASVQTALDHYGISDPSPATRAALEQFVIAERATSRWAERAGLLFLPLLTPDFQMG
jgi:uncharacterized protein (DUF1800 family)